MQLFYQVVRLVNSKFCVPLANSFAKAIWEFKRKPKKMQKLYFTLCKLLYIPNIAISVITKQFKKLKKSSKLLDNKNIQWNPSKFSFHFQYDYFPKLKFFRFKNDELFSVESSYHSEIRVFGKFTMTTTSNSAKVRHHSPWQQDVNKSKRRNVKSSNRWVEQKFDWQL